MLYNMILYPRHISLHYLYVHSLTLGLSENGSAGNISGSIPANDANDAGGLFCYII